MNPDQNHPPRQALPGDFDLTTWLAGRLDRLEETVETKIEAVLEDAKDTRHTQRGTISTMVTQMAVLVNTVHEVVEQQKIDRSDIDQIQGWRNRMTGAIGILAFLFPATIAAVAAVLAHHPT